MAVEARLRRPWGHSQGQKGVVKEAFVCVPCLAGTAKVAVGARPRPWSRGQSDRWGAAKGPGGAGKAAVCTQQGPGLDAKAAMVVRPLPWGRGHGGHGDADKALMVKQRQPLGVSEYKEWIYFHSCVKSPNSNYIVVHKLVCGRAATYTKRTTYHNRYHFHGVL